MKPLRPTYQRNGFCLWLKRLESERFKTKPDAGDEAIELTVDELNWLLDGIDRNRSINPVLVDGFFQEAEAEAGEQFHGSSAS